MIKKKIQGAFVLMAVLALFAAPMANADEVKVNTGFSIGGVAPIAHLKKLNILIDQSLGRFESVFAAAGHPNSIFKIKYNQLVQMTKGEVKEITE